MPRQPKPMGYAPGCHNKVSPIADASLNLSSLHPWIPAKVRTVQIPHFVSSYLHTYILTIAIEAVQETAVAALHRVVCVCKVEMDRCLGTNCSDSADTAQNDLSMHCAAHALPAASHSCSGRTLVLHR
eukprot:3750725-Prymnesium_polylepis.1